MREERKKAHPHGEDKRVPAERDQYAYRADEETTGKASDAGDGSDREAAAGRGVHTDDPEERVEDDVPAVLYRQSDLVSGGAADEPDVPEAQNKVHGG